MSQEKISRSILEEAEKKAETILNEAEKKTSDIRQKGREETEKLKRYQDEMIKQLSEREKDKHISLAQLDMNMDILSEKRKSLDSVFAEALENILKRDEKYSDRLIKAILSAAKTGKETIHVCAQDLKIINDAFIKKLNKNFQGKGDFKASPEHVRIRGGAVLREGKMTTDASFETIVEEERYFLEKEVSQLLFGEGV